MIQIKERLVRLNQVHHWVRRTVCQQRPRCTRYELSRGGGRDNIGAMNRCIGVGSRFTPRPAVLADAAAAADLYLFDRHAAVPAIPPPVHSDEDVRHWFKDVVIPQRNVARRGGWRARRIRSSPAKGRNGSMSGTGSSPWSTLTAAATKNRHPMFDTCGNLDARLLPCRANNVAQPVPQTARTRVGQSLEAPVDGRNRSFGAEVRLLGGCGGCGDRLDESAKGRQVARCVDGSVGHGVVEVGGGGEQGVESDGVGTGRGVRVGGFAWLDVQPAGLGLDGPHPVAELKTARARRRVGGGPPLGSSYTQDAAGAGSLRRWMTPRLSSSRSRSATRFELAVGRA